MGGYFILFPIFFYSSATFKHCPGHWDGHAISRTIPDDEGRITCMHYNYIIKVRNKRIPKQNISNYFGQLSISNIQITNKF